MVEKKLEETDFAGTSTIRMGKPTDYQAQLKKDLAIEAFRQLI